MSIEEGPDTTFIPMFESMVRTLKDRGWSQRRLCAALGFTESWLSKIKHAGQGMDLTVFVRICELTGIPPEKLLSGYPLPKAAETELEEISKILEKMPPDELRRRILKSLKE